MTGDLPAVAAVPRPLPPVADAPPAPGTAVAAVAAARSAGGGSTTGQRRPPTPLPVFDPPLIAQRAVLGLPIGDLVAGLAGDRGISWSAASAMVDREVDRALPAPDDPPRDSRPAPAQDEPGQRTSRGCPGTCS